MATEVYPVIHINDEAEAREQVSIAAEANADGVYLIDHHTPNSSRLLNVLKAAKSEHPNFFIGINDLSSPNAFSLFSSLLKKWQDYDLTALPDGVWVDDASKSTTKTAELRRDYSYLNGIRYLGGVAFKYTPLFTEDPHSSAREALRLEPSVDVVTTSGSGTGTPPSPGKIKAMKEAIQKPLAVASGVSYENLGNYEGNIDQLLVASSVETKPGSGIFESTKLTELIQMAHNL